MDYRLMTAFAFVQSYDRDVLELQDNPEEYITELEAELERLNPQATAYDRNGNKVWPICVMKTHLGITGGPQWPEQKPLRL